MKQPNILWICTDQQRKDSLSCYGNPFTNTTHIDSLAQSGVLFENCTCQAPVCTPSRASYLTGRYPHTTTCRQNGQKIPGRETLITKLFHDAGYVCGLAGKFHLAPGHPTHTYRTEERIDDGFDVFDWCHEPCYKWATSSYHRWLHEKGVEYKVTPSSLCSYVDEGMPAQYHYTTWCVEKAISFIDTCEDLHRPWHFTINTFDPHAPFDPPKDYWDHFISMMDQFDLPDYVEGELDNKPVFQLEEHNFTTNSSKSNRGYNVHDMTQQDHRYIKAAYYAMVKLIDDQIGRLLDHLKKRNLLDNTLILFMSDHGEMLGDHGIYLKGPFFYECLSSVPLILSWPGHIAQNVRRSALIELTDLAPTLLDLLGLDYPQGLQGTSFTKLLQKDAEDFHRENVFCEFYNALAYNDPPAYLTMLKTKRYKLVVTHGFEVGELYDLKEDPGEHYNLWDDPAHQPLKMQLMKQLMDRMAFTMDPLPARQCPY
ncbi:MAG: sulfatase [Eubacteriales bacterium]|jgi:arylsulfatase